MDAIDNPELTQLSDLTQVNTGIENNTTTELPFTYVRTKHEQIAAYTVWRKRLVIEGKPKLLKTDEEIVETVKGQRENKDWYTDEYWRSKGKPSEQIEIKINGNKITIYNWNKEKPFTDEHILLTQKVFREIVSRFPQILKKIR